MKKISYQGEYNQHVLESIKLFTETSASIQDKEIDI